MQRLASVIACAWSCMLRRSVHTCRITHHDFAESMHIAACWMDKLQAPRANGAFESRHTMTASAHASRVVHCARAAYMCASCVGSVYVIRPDVTERERGRFLKI